MPTTTNFEGGRATEEVWAQNDVEANSNTNSSGGFATFRVSSEGGFQPPLPERPGNASGYGYLRTNSSGDLRSPSVLVVRGLSDPLPDVENEVEAPSTNATVQQTSTSGSTPPLPKYTLCCNLCIYLTTFYCIIFVVLIITLLILFL